MGLFHSGVWTGGDVADAVERPKPAVKSAKVEPKAAQPTRDNYLAEYAELAECVGVASPDLGLETFKDFLRKQDWGIFSLAEVVAYMDKKAKAESKEQAGWQWRPLREKDHVIGASFGQPAERARDQWGRATGNVDRPASDWYVGPQERQTPELVWETVPVAHQQMNGSWSNNSVGSATAISRATGKMLRQVAASLQSSYDKTIPLHALRKIAVIEREFKATPVSFFVCDYATAPQIEHPDPFLMAVIDNPKLNIGVGRFIIDFWDEPGFGLEQSLK